MKKILTLAFLAASFSWAAPQHVKHVSAEQAKQHHKGLVRHVAHGTARGMKAVGKVVW